MNDYVLNALIGGITSFLTWAAMRRKNIAEARTSEVDTVERAIKVWRDLSEDLQKRYEALIIKVESLQSEIEGLRADNKSLSYDNKQLLKKLSKQNAQ